MAWTYEQNFEDLNLADLDGQDSWTDGGGAMVVADTITAAEGDQYAYSATDNTLFGRTISDVTVGTYYISMRTSRTVDTSGNIYVLHTSNGNYVFYVQFRLGNLEVYNGTQNNTGKSISADTWYRVGIDFDATYNSNEGRVRVNLDGDTWSDWYAFNTGCDGAIDAITLATSGSYAKYWDFISPDYAPVSDLDVSVSDQVNITEAVTMELLANISVSDQVNITEAVTVTSELTGVSVSDQVNITEAVTVTSELTGIEVSDEVNITEAVAIDFPLELSVSDEITITDTLNVSLVHNVGVFDEVNITESTSLNVSPVQLIPSGKAVATDTTTATSAEDIAGLTFDITLPRDGYILAFMSLEGKSDTIKKNGYYLIDIDGTNSPVIQRYYRAANRPGSIGVVFRSGLLAAGTYTVKGEHYTEAGVTLTTTNATLIAWSSIDAGGNSYPIAYGTTASDSTTSPTLENIDDYSDTLDNIIGSHLFGVSVGSCSATNNSVDYGWGMTVGVDSSSIIRKIVTGSDVGAVGITCRTEAPTTTTPISFSGQHSISAGTATVAPAIGIGAALGFNDYGIDWGIPSGHRLSGAVQSTASASLVDIPESDTQITINATAHIFACMTISATSSVANKTGSFALNINGTDYEVVQRFFSSTDRGSVTIFTRTTSALAPGTYTVKGRWATDGGTLSSVGDISITTIGLQTQKLIFDINVSDQANITEAITITNPLTGIEVNDEITITETVELLDFLLIKAVELVHIGESSGETELMLYNDFPRNSGVLLKTGFYHGQQFTANWDFTITSLKILTYKNSGATGTITLNIYNTDGNGLPTGSPIATATRDISGYITTPGQLEEFTFGTPAELTSGNQYVFACTSDSEENNTANSYSWGGTVSGYIVNSSNDGASWNVGSWVSRMIFEIYGYASPSIFLTLLSNISVNDEVNITETISRELLFNVSIFDEVNITETITITNSSLGDIEVSDEITITETVNQTLANNVVVSDEITITETITSELLINLSVSDQVNITEAVTLMNGLGDISVSDEITITETISASTIYLINVFDTVEISESITFNIYSYISISDQVNITDSYVVDLQSNISVSDSITITEATSFLVHDPMTGLVHMRSKQQSQPITINDTSNFEMRKANNYPLAMDDDSVL